MRVLILVNSLKWLLTVREELVDSLLDEGAAVGIVGLFDGGETEFQRKGCSCYSLFMDRRGTNIFSDLKLVIGYRRTIRDFKPDVVLTFSIKANIYGLFALKNAHVPSIVTITGLGSGLLGTGALSKLVALMYKAALKNASCVFFQNTSNFAFMKNKGIIRNNQRTRLVSGSGVNLEKFAVQDYPSDGKGIRFLFVGRIMKEKGVGELLKAFEAMWASYPSTSLHILGFLEEDLKEHLNLATKSLPVFYHGEVKDVRPFIAESHCTVLPSYHEGMANVLLEAAASGRPVITSRIPGCEETFDEGISGFGCLPRNVASLQQAMERLVSLSNKQRKAMGIAGRGKMERKFDRKLVIKAYLDEVRSLSI